MIPLVGTLAEFKQQALQVKAIAEQVKEKCSIYVQYEIGTMIEVPRMALIANQIAGLVDKADGKNLCEFFLFGTNDLTQMTMGISRDDAGAFVPHYLEDGILDKDPFKTIDTNGVGWLVRLMSAKGQSANPNLLLSVCGEHGGDPKSISFFDDVGLDYVLCLLFHVPVTRLAAGLKARSHLDIQHELTKQQEYILIFQF